MPWQLMYDSSEMEMVGDVDDWEVNFEKYKKGLRAERRYRAAKKLQDAREAKRDAEHERVNEERVARGEEPLPPRERTEVPIEIVPRQQFIPESHRLRLRARMAKDEEEAFEAECRVGLGILTWEEEAVRMMKIQKYKPMKEMWLLRYNSADEVKEIMKKAEEDEYRYQIDREERIKRHARHCRVLRKRAAEEGVTLESLIQAELREYVEQNNLFVDPLKAEKMKEEEEAEAAAEAEAKARGSKGRNKKVKKEESSSCGSASS